MKKLTLLLIAILTIFTVNAQQKGYVCTGNHVNIRTGAGIKYPVMDDGAGHKRQMSISQSIRVSVFSLINIFNVGE